MAKEKQAKEVAIQERAEKLQKEQDKRLAEAKEIKERAEMLQRELAQRKADENTILNVKDKK